MSEFERFALALAKTESGDFELAWGDSKKPEAVSGVQFGGFHHSTHGADFMAMGRWQMHPVWYAEWADPAIQVGWSWDAAFRAALRRFWDDCERKGWAVEYRAQVFHLGMSAVVRGDVDYPYGARFWKFWEAQISETKA